MKQLIEIYYKLDTNKTFIVLWGTIVFVNFLHQVIETFDLFLITLA